MLGRLSRHQQTELVYQEGYVEGCVMCLSHGVRWVNSGEKSIGRPSAFDWTHFTLGKNRKFSPLMADRRTNATTSGGEIEGISQRIVTVPKVLSVQGYPL